MVKLVSGQKALMTPINNSDTAWLIVSDYNQDNNLPYEDLREDILNPQINDDYFEDISSGVGDNHKGVAAMPVNNIGGRGQRVGSISGFAIESRGNFRVGEPNGGMTGELAQGGYVGGNYNGIRYDISGN